MNCQARQNGAYGIADETNIFNRAKNMINGSKYFLNKSTQ